jgi:quinol monooxygenase YgiN
MSVHVATEFKTKSHYADSLIAALAEALPDSLSHDGCEAISLRRDQDDPNHVVSFTQWTTRKHYEDYLAWRTEQGMTDDVGEMLTEPMTITYFDEVIKVPR